MKVILVLEKEKVHYHLNLKKCLITMILGIVFLSFIINAVYSSIGQIINNKAEAAEVKTENTNTFLEKEINLQESIALNSKINLQKQIVLKEKELNKLNKKLQKNTYLLAKLIQCEDGTQDYKELDQKVAIGIVVLNRIKSKEFPDEIEEVIFQKNQFSCTSDGSWEKKEPMELDYIAAQLALEESEIIGSNGNKINDALFYLRPEHSNPKYVKWFKENLKYLDKVGYHEFYTLKNN